MVSHYAASDLKEGELSWYCASSSFTVTFKFISI